MSVSVIHSRDFCISVFFSEPNWHEVGAARLERDDVVHFFAPIRIQQMIVAGFECDRDKVRKVLFDLIRSDS